MALVVLVGSGLLGVRTDSTSVVADGLAVTVDYPAITRPGMASPLTITVRSLGDPLPEILRVRTDTSYLEVFDEYSLSPTPVDSCTTGQWTWWTFAPPPDSEELMIAFDARLTCTYGERARWLSPPAAIRRRPSSSRPGSCPEGR